jgi:trans-AT polyketide synthase/acyltransferase/oxidoreductase domain-containing protein
MEFLLNHGVRELEELGPGKVLRKLWATATADLALRAAPTEGSSPTVERVTGEELGDEAFRRDYGVRYAYLVGSPASGIRTAELVTTLGKAGLLGYLDSFAADPQGRARAIDQVSHRLGPGGCFGVSLRQNERQGSGVVGSLEEEMVEVALHRGVRFAEAAGYGAVTPALVRFRLQGAYRDEAGKPVAVHRLLALVSRPGLASQFLNSPPQEMVASLVGKGVLTAGEGEIARHVPLASDLCAVSGTGEGADMSTLLPTILRLRDRAAVERGGSEKVRVGAGGAIGTPEAVACAFLLGADFVQTSSINMCCLEAGVSTAVKELLAGLEFGDTTNAPAVEGFCLGAQVQVVKKGSLFAPRAQRLYELYRFYDSLEDIPATDREKLEKKVFKRSFDSILDSLSRERRQEVDRRDARAKMVCVFTWYLEQSFDRAMTGEVSEKINFQIPCDESMAAFNQYAEGSDLEEGTRRGVVALGERLMTDAATFLAQSIDRCGAP